MRQHSAGRRGCCRSPLGVGMAPAGLLLLLLLLSTVTAELPGATQQGVAPARNAPSAASPRNYSSPPHSSLPSPHDSELPLPKITAHAPLSPVEGRTAAQLDSANSEDDNTTLSDHTFQEIIRSNHDLANSNPNINITPGSSSFLVKLSSYLFNKNLQKSITQHGDSTKAFTPQPLSSNTENPPSTKSELEDAMRNHPAEKHPPFEDYLGPIQFQSSLTQSIIHRELSRARVAPTKKPSNLYVEWDRDSSEQEVEAEKEVNLTFAKPMWFLMALAGNETIAKLRREDFVKYVRVNVAARLSLQYDEVRVLRLQLTPRILLNISIASSRRSPVMALLAADTAPLLELSGEEYIIAPLDDPITAEQQTGVVPTSPEGSQEDLEAAVCALAGGACALAAGAALLVAALFRRQRPQAGQRAEPLRLPPAVIYTGRLECVETKDVMTASTTLQSLKTPMDPRVQPDTLPLDARYVEELGLDNPNFLTP